MLWAFPFCIPICIKLKKKEIREKMTEELTIRKLETIILTEEDVKWVDKHEIWVNNRMFDISQKKLENGIYTFTGLYDDEETELIQKEKKSEDPESNLLLARFFNCLLNVFYQQQDTFSILFIVSPIKFVSNSQKPCLAYKEINTPPPKARLAA